MRFLTHTSYPENMVFLFLVAYEVHYNHRDQVQSSGYFTWDHESRPILQWWRTQVLCQTGKEVSKWHLGRINELFSLCSKRAGLIGLFNHQSLWIHFQASDVEISPVSTLLNPLYRILSQLSLVFLLKEWLLSWHHFPLLTWPSCNLSDLQLEDKFGSEQPRYVTG